LSSAFIAVSAIVPSWFLMWYFHRRDVHPEPPRVLWATFGLGFVITVPVVIVAWPVDALIGQLQSPLAYGFASAFFAAAIPEELFKFLVLWRYAARHPAFDEPMDGIVYGVAASLGFATLENILYVADGGAPVAILRALTAVPGHAFMGAIMGYFVGRAKFDGARRRAWLTRALAIPMLLHGAYDTPLLAGERVDEASPDPLVMLLLLTVPVILIAEGVWATRISRRLRAEQGQTPPLPPLPAATVAPAGWVPLRQRLAVPAPPPPVAAAVAIPEPAARAAVPAPRPPGRTGAWVLTLLGGAVASCGGLLVLGILAGLAFGAAEEDEIGSLLLGTAILGGAPFFLGGWMFVAGVRRLDRTAATASAVPTATEFRG
jgi:protease PrsW